MHIYVISMKRLYTAALALALAAVLFFFGMSIYPYAGERMEDALAASAEASLPEKIIIIDPGHGGEDCGAIGADGTYEKDLNLAVSLVLGNKLTDLGYTVIYTRTDDRLLYREEENIFGFRKIYDLRNRCALSEDYPQAMYVSVHMNSFGQASCRGLQVYYAPDRADSHLFAEKIQQAVVENLQPDNHRTIRSGKDLYLLEHVKNPVVLIECGFISNAEECADLSDEGYRNRLADAIAQGIVAFDSAG